MTYILGLMLGWAGIALGAIMTFSTEVDYVQPRYIAFLAVLLVTSAMFFAIDVWKEKNV